MDVPIEVICRTDGTLYVITADEVDVISRSGLTYEEFANLSKQDRRYILNHY